MYPRSALLDFSTALMRLRVGLEGFPTLLFFSVLIFVGIYDGERPSSFFNRCHCFSPLLNVLLIQPFIKGLLRYSY